MTRPRTGRTGDHGRPKGLHYTTLLLVAFVALVHAQQRGGTAQTDRVQPVNSGAIPFGGPHPYRRCPSGSANTKRVEPWLGTGISGVS